MSPDGEEEIASLAYQLAGLPWKPNSAVALLADLVSVNATHSARTDRSRPAGRRAAEKPAGRPWEAFGIKDDSGDPPEPFASFRGPLAVLRKYWRNPPMRQDREPTSSDQFPRWRPESYQQGGARQEPPAVLTIARIPARIASGSPGQASITACSSGPMCEVFVSTAPASAPVGSEIPAFPWKIAVFFTD